MNAVINTETLTTVHGACPHDCPDTCALVVSVSAGRVIKVHGRSEHPSTHGALCTKVSRYPERTYHAERVLRPMKRVSAKTEPPRFEPVSWAEALSDIAARLTAIAARDPQAIQPYSYAGTMGQLQGESMSARFFHRIGASLLDRTICASAGRARFPGSGRRSVERPDAGSAVSRARPLRRTVVRDLSPDRSRRGREERRAATRPAGSAMAAGLA